MRFVRTLAWTWAVVPAALVVSAAIAHAGQPGDSGGSFPAPNPCSLLSSAEIGAAAGVAAVNEGAILFRNGSTASRSFARTGGGRIMVFIRRLPSGEWAAEQVDRMRRGVSFGSYREVGAVGERGFLLDRKAVGFVLCVFRNPYYLQISALGVGDGMQEPAVLEKLARTALRRLASVTAKGGFHCGSKTVDAPSTAVTCRVTPVADIWWA